MEGIATMTLAATFAAAASGKLRAPTAFRAALTDLVPSAPLVRALALLVPGLELLLALFVLSGVSPRAAGVACAVAIVLLSAALGRMWTLGTAQDCGCFGESVQASNPATGFIRNGLLLLAAGSVVAEPARSILWTADPDVIAANAVITLGIFVLWSASVTLVLRWRLLTTGMEAR